MRLGPPRPPRPAKVRAARDILPSIHLLDDRVDFSRARRKASVPRRRWIGGCSAARGRGSPARRDPDRRSACRPWRPVRTSGGRRCRHRRRPRHRLADRMAGRKSVRNAPGATAVTLTPNGRTSCARLADRPSSAYWPPSRGPTGARRASGDRGDVDNMARPWARRCGRAARMIRNGANTSTSNSRVTSESVAFSSAPRRP